VEVTLLIVTTDRDDESGRFREQYSTEAFVEAVQELDVATTSKIAERVGCSYDLAYRRLKTLAEEDEIERTDVAGSFVWKVPD
jgi:CTP-dependent riboflavin kinase